MGHFIMYLIIMFDTISIGLGALIGLIICIILQMFTPTTKEAAVIVVVPKIINVVNEHDGLKKLPDNLINLANDWLVELKPENIKNTVGK